MESKQVQPSTSTQVKQEKIEDAPTDANPQEVSAESLFRQPTPKTPTIKKESPKYFNCTDCNLHEEYNYFGKYPPFCKQIKFLEDSYLVRDPFTPYSGNNQNFLLLGSNCSVCSKMTCQDCSVFFTKRFCGKCYKLIGNQLPEELLKSLKKKVKTEEK